MKKKAIWIGWERHRRSQSLSKELAIPIHEVIFPGRSIKRYIRSSFKTLEIIKSNKPDVIFFQNPSIALALLLVLTKYYHKAKLVMDAHNAGVYPLEGRFKLLQALARWLIRGVDLTIVTNSHLAEIVKEVGGEFFVLSDPIPKISCADRKCSYPKEYILFICTWAEDEPYIEVLEAIRSLSKLDIDLRVTGKAPDSIVHRFKDRNIILEGFVSEKNYEALLCNAKLVIDLTTRSNCLVCGAYEAAAVGRPAILSDDKTTREVFSNGFVFTKNNEHDIARVIEESINLVPDLEDKINDFRDDYSSRLNSDLTKLKNHVGI
ncbi:glycosyltransferase [Marinobacter mobilis]|uniref:Glycosyltransferase involved in cell wall bisynthesis n=1 Tax=Marinobacter mobilis TaxID=488533 RepID=A0A1H2UWP1_9GAMM|nr:glycosyltransferase [Marinobacter mobilis]SDW60029.1 Glycosyltransferase involved in cell wall bisynthesis [Marinobacter mobilis]